MVFFCDLQTPKDHFKTFFKDDVTKKYFCKTSELLKINFLRLYFGKSKLFGYKT